jgi:IclR family pca regulon transcriptional regulator
VAARVEHVQSLDRGLAVMRAFSASSPALTVADAARATGLTRATVRRLLHTLTALGYVASDGKHFELTPKVLDLGYAYLSSLRLADLALPYMEELSERTGESCSAAVLDGTDIVYVARVPTKRVMSITLSVGSRLPAEMTSMGRVLLADLAPDDLDRFIAALPDGAPRPQTERSITDLDVLRRDLANVRARGWSLVDQELESGVRSVAAPLRNRRGRAVAALNVSSNTARVSLEELCGDMVRALLDSANRISGRLARR